MVYNKGTKSREAYTTRFQVIIEHGEKSGYVARCPALPGCHSQGATIEEALENIKDAIVGCLEVLNEITCPQRLWNLIP
jgi:predicted RNase H-like HicB family nuclease